MANQKDQPDLIEIPMNKIKLGDNSRMNIATSELADLMSSIKEHGMLQAPVVIKAEKGGYDLVAGRRRFLACSKLGWSKLKCSVITVKDDADLLMKNLTENIQRQNISLTEVGRYIELLRSKQTMTSAEIAIRLGVTKNYVETATRAYNEVPEEFQKHLVLTKGNDRPKPGQIPITTAKAIINTKKTHRLTNAQAKKLFHAARTDDSFQSQNIVRYAEALKLGKKKFTKAVAKSKTLRLQYAIAVEDYDDLMEKYVENGPFSGMQALILAVLRGEKAVKIPAFLRNK